MPADTSPISARRLGCQLVRQELLPSEQQAASGGLRHTGKPAARVRAMRMNGRARSAVLTSITVDDDVDLVDRLCAGDESAFVEVVNRYQPRLLALAQATVGSRAVAEEVTQDTWLAVMRGIDRFEGRSSFKVWLFRVLLNRARTTAGREQRAGRPEDDIVERFDHAGHWAPPPVPWADRVDDRLVAEGLAARVHSFLAELPDNQRQVVILRDVEHVSADDVAAMLGISEGNQRVLLHRGRTRLRALLAAEMGDDR
jgi:RNA polymerase sigma-70 factor (ECF subfamily)